MVTITAQSLQSNEHAALIRMLRKKRRVDEMTQAKLAKLMEWRQSEVSRLEVGDRRLDIFEFIKITEALDLDPHAVLDEIIAESKK